MVTKRKARKAAKKTSFSSNGKKSTTKSIKSSKTASSLVGSKSAADSTSKGRVNKIAIIIVVLFVVGGLFYLIRQQFIVATVNGTPIFRHTLTNELEKQLGKQVLDNLVAEAMIKQEAKKRDIVITDEEINKEIEKVKTQLNKQGQDFGKLLELQGMTIEDLEKQVRLQKMVEALVEESVNVTDEEVEEFFKQNKEFLKEDADEEEAKENIREQLRQQKISQEAQGLIQSLKDAATINYFGNYVQEDK